MFNEAKQVVGVQYVFEGKRNSVLINNEVILAAGNIGSPQLLMHSGIGQPAVLQQFKVSMKLVVQLDV